MFVKNETRCIWIAYLFLELACFGDPRPLRVFCLEGRWGSNVFRSESFQSSDLTQKCLIFRRTVQLTSTSDPLILTRSAHFLADMCHLMLALN